MEPLLLCWLPLPVGHLQGVGHQAVTELPAHPPQLHLVSGCVAPGLTLHRSEKAPRGSLWPVGITLVSQGGKVIRLAVARLAFLLVLNTASNSPLNSITRILHDMTVFGGAPSENSGPQQLLTASWGPIGVPIGQAFNKWTPLRLIGLHDSSA